MKKAVALTMMKIFLVVSLFLVSQSLIADDNATITGTVNEYFQIITDAGEVYNIGDTEKGAELDDKAGKRVEAFGNVVDSDGEWVIMIADFKIMDSGE